MARWDSLTGERTMGRTRSPRPTAWSCSGSLKTRLKSMATGVLRGHKNCSFWYSRTNRRSRQRHDNVSALERGGGSAESAQTDRRLPLAKVTSDAEIASDSTVD